jgi:hypothetical protein
MKVVSMRRSLAYLLLLFLITACNWLSGLLPPAMRPSPTSTATLPRSGTPTATTTLEPSPTQDLVLGIQVVGSEAFIDQTNAALDLLAQCAPDALLTADEYLDAIQESDRSGMVVESGTFMASLSTAFAPEYSLPAQVFWYAGSIVHDARHNWQSKNGMTTNWGILTLAEREAIEADARGVQIAALQLCVDFVDPSARSEVDWMLQYLIDMQNGVIPCDYCEVEWADRDW